MFTFSEREAVGKLIVAAERVLNETDVNTLAQVEACRDLHTILLAITAVISDEQRAVRADQRHAARADPVGVTDDP